MAHYLVCPFKNFGRHRSPIDKAVRAKLKMLAKAGATLLDLGSLNSLQHLQAGDVLLIEGHGWMRSDRLFSTSRLEKAATLDVNELAAQIAGARLPLHHRMIAVLSCFGAGELAADAAIVDSPERAADVERFTRFMSNEGDGTLARWLAIALGQRHYANVAVSGYRGEVITSQRRRFTGLRVRTRYHTERDPFGYSEAVESAIDPERRTFDARGRELANQPDPLAGLAFD